MKLFPKHGRMLLAVILVLLKISVLSVYGQNRTEYQSKWVENQLNLHDHVEELSSISTIQSMGFTGKGVTIAVIGTGIDRNHEQYSGRVIAENCFNSGRKCVPTERCESCEANDANINDPYVKECLINCYDCQEHFVCENNGNSSNPINAEKKESFNQGSHLAGIAAGADGIAPGANIVAVNIQSEYVNNPDLFTKENPEGYSVSMQKDDLKKALEWLLELHEGGTTVSVVIIDFSSDEYDFECDWESGCEDFYDIFERMIDAGMIPVAGTGDHYRDHSISFPACLSNVIAVGALPDMSKPMIAAYSDHHDMVDILAPGTNIYSANLVNTWEGNYSCENNCYGEMDGTSEAASVTGGALALLMEAFPGKTFDAYKSMLQEMSTISVNRRNSNTHDNLTNDDGTGTQFEFDKPILDFSNFTSYYKNVADDTDGTVVISDHIPQGQSGITMIGDIHTKDEDGINASIQESSDEKRIIAGNITAEGEKGNGIDAIVSSKGGKLILNVYDNISAGNAGIVIHEDNEGPLDIFVAGTIDAGKAGILVAGSIKSVQGEGFPGNISITAGKIIPNKNGNIAEYKDGSKAENIEDVINYIISIDQPKNGKVEVVQEDGTPWTQQNHRRNTAKKGQRVYFQAPAGLEVFDKNTNKVLPQTGDGLYYLDVPNGGGVEVYTKSKHSNVMEFFHLSVLPKTGFSALHPQELRFKPLNVRYTSTNLVIQIPQLSIQSKLLLVPEISGEYPVEWLGDSIGMLEGSALPGKGIMILTAHNHLNTTENGPFVALGTLNMGDRIFLTDENAKLYTYNVSGNYKIGTDGFALIAGDLGENTLVMITCEEEAVSGGYLYRRVILADPL